MFSAMLRADTKAPIVGKSKQNQPHISYFKHLSVSCDTHRMDHGPTHKCPVSL